MRRQYSNIQRGFSLLEMLIYISILTITAVIVVDILLSTAKSYNSFKISRSINSTVSTSLERMTREIRAADDVLLIGSTFDTHPGRLTLQIASTTSEFYLDGNVLKIKEGGIDAGSLTSSKLSVDNLVFRLLDNGVSKAVRIEMTLLGTERNITKAKTFYSFAVLRNSY